jgi:hypothetical protein
MGYHNQAFRQCADCYHWIGNNCRTASAGPELSADSVAAVCRAFLRGSLVGLFDETTPPQQSFARR